MIKSMLAILLFASPLVAQDQAGTARAAAGCGPADVQFDVKTDKNQHPIAQPEAGKALVVVFQEERQDPGINLNLAAPLTRVGLDGKWVGANRGQSYFFFSVDPGDHRLCTNWQSSFKRLSKLGSAVTFTAEAGKVYFFRQQVEERHDRSPNLQLEPADNADGQFKIASLALSTSRPKPKETASK